MTIEFPARRSGAHYPGPPTGEHFFTGDRAHGPLLSRRALLKLGAGTTALAAASAYALDKTSSGHKLRGILDTQSVRPVKQLTLVGTDGWVAMPPSAAPGGTAWPSAFAPDGRNVYIFGFAVGGRFETPNRLTWADAWNGVPGSPAEAIGGLAALKNRANLSAPILYFHEGDDVRISLWNGGMGHRPDIVDAHTIHWHGFPNQIPYFDGVPNGSLSVPIGANLVYRYLPYHGMAGSYMWHCHVSDAEHVQMGLQGIVYIRPYQNYGIPVGSPYNRTNVEIPKARATDPSASGPLGYAFNDGVGFTYTGPGAYPAGSTAYDREFAFIIDEVDPRIHSDDANFQFQDFSQYTPRFGTLNGRAWPDTILGNWDVTVTDPGPDRVNRYAASTYYNKPFLYNIATEDQNTKGSDGTPAYLTQDLRLGSQPWSSLIQANAGETIVLRFSNLGYWEHSMELAGLPFRLIGMDAKNLLEGRDGYEENPNPDYSAASPLTLKRSDISSTTYRTQIGVAESRELLVQIPKDAFNADGTPVVFEFFDRNDLMSKNATDGGPVVGGMRTQLHVFPPAGQKGSLPPQQFPQQVFNPGGIYK